MPRKGKKKEGRVASILSRIGYKVLARNKIIHLNQHKKGEIDLVVKRGKRRYVVEVKSGKQIIKKSNIEKLIKKANKTKSKPWLITGPNVKLSKLAKELIKKMKVKWKVL